MNKILIYVGCILIGLCIYLHLNKKDKFNIGGQVPLFMCSSEQYQNHPDCLPEAFCQDLEDGEVCTVDNFVINNEKNRGYFREYYENLKSVLTNLYN